MASTTPVDESRVQLDLTTHLPVVEESTTSRVLVDNDAMRVVQFTFDAGELLTEHASPRAVVVQLVTGRIGSPSRAPNTPWPTGTSSISRPERGMPWSPTPPAG